MEILELYFNYSGVVAKSKSRIFGRKVYYTKTNFYHNLEMELND